MGLGGSHDRWGHKILLLRSQGWWQVHPSEILKTTIALKGAVFLSAGQASDILNCAGRQIFLLGTAKGPEALLLTEDAHRFFFFLLEHCGTPPLATHCMLSPGRV